MYKSVFNTIRYPQPSVLCFIQTSSSLWWALRETENCWSLISNSQLVREVTIKPLTSAPSSWRLNLKEELLEHCPDQVAEGRPVRSSQVKGLLCLDVIHMCAHSTHVLKPISHVRCCKDGNLIQLQYWEDDGPLGVYSIRSRHQGGVIMREHS